MRQENSTKSSSPPPDTVMSLIFSISALLICISIPVFGFYLDRSTTFWVAGFSVFLSILTFETERWPLVYILRSLLIFMPGAMTGYLLHTQASGTFVMNHALNLQDDTTGTRVFFLSAAALACSSLGWVLGRAFFPSMKLSRKSLSVRSAHIYFFVFSTSAIIFGSLLAYSLGPYVWQSAYSVEVVSPLFGFTASNFFVAASIVGLYCLLMMQKKLGIAYWIIFAGVAFYSLFLCMLFRGMRGEFVATLFALTATDAIISKREWGKWKILGAFGMGYVFVMAWGAYRAAAATGFNIIDAWDYSRRHSLHLDAHGNFFFETGTLGDLADTFYSAIALVDRKIVLLFHGKSYLDYIARTLPAFIYPNRPQDLSLIVFGNRGIPFGGGIFELTEAYLNFGPLGCYLVPFALSFILSSIFEFAKATSSFIPVFFFGVMAAAVFRGTLYQSFTFYRAATIFLSLVMSAHAFMWLENKWGIRKDV